MHKILVTGHQGYIGVHLVDLLLQEGYHVTGCDLQLFEGCALEPYISPHVQLNRDFRSLTLEEVSHYDCIMHLAAISNDPMGDLEPGITYKVNRDGTIDLVQKAKIAGVKRFLFASSCSIYGKGRSLSIDESGETAPLTAYAISKIAAEEKLQELNDKNFIALCLRNATAYGYSPMLRIDLVVNNLLACAFSKAEIRVMSDGSPWRPLIHCKDIARAFVAFMKAPKSALKYPIVNVGANEENYQVKDIVNKVLHCIPQAKVVYTGEIGADPRNYQVNFDLLKKVLPEFILEYSLERGIDELFHKFKQHGFSAKDFESDKFIRLKTLNNTLKKLMHPEISQGREQRAVLHR